MGSNAHFNALTIAASGKHLRLTKSNWFQWKREFQACLLNCGLLGYTNGKKQPLIAKDTDTAAETLEVKNFFRNSCSVYSRLIESVSAEVQPIFYKVELNEDQPWETVAAIYTCLKEAFESTKDLSLQTSLQKLMSLKQNGKSLRDHCAEATLLYQQLVNCENAIAAQHKLAVAAAATVSGSVVPTEEKLSMVAARMALLNSLDPEYAFICGSIEALEKVPTFAEVMLLLERKMPAVEGGNTKVVVPSGALQVDTANCSHCHKPGHKVATCYKLHPELLTAAKKKWEKKAKVASSDKSTVENALMVHRVQSTGASGEIEFVLDSGASNHYINARSLLSDFNPTDCHEVSTADSKILTKGSGLFPGITARVHWVPEFSRNLLSVSQLANCGISCLFTSTGATLMRVSTGSTIVNAIRTGNMYVLKLGSQLCCPAVQMPAGTLMDWHCRLGHPGSLRLYKALNLAGYEFTMNECKALNCDVCSQCKTVANPHRNLNMAKRSTVPLEIIHMDIKSIEVSSLSGANYVLVIRDDFTRMLYTYPLKTKGEVSVALNRFFVDEVESTGRTVSKVWCDNAQENVSSPTRDVCDNHGARIINSSPYESEENGIAERAILVLQQTARCLLKESGFSKSFWAEAYHHACMVNNYLACASNQWKSPWLMLHGSLPDLTHLRRFGEHCFVHDNTPGRKSLDPSACPGRYLGCALKNPKWFRVLLNSNKVVETAVIYRSAAIPLSVPDLIVPDDGYVESNELPVLDSDIPIMEDLPEVGIVPGVPIVDGELRRSGRKVFPNQMIQDLPYEMEAAGAQRLSPAVVHADPRFKVSMKKELDSLFEQGVMIIGDRPVGRQLITATWVHTYKKDERGEGSVTKSRLCPRGFQQREHVDYDPREVAAPTLQLSTVMLLLALEVTYSLKSKIVDAVGVFRVPELDNKIPMEFPEGMDPIPGKCLWLLHALHGLKQAAYHWTTLVSRLLLDNGFLKSPGDACLYAKETKDGKVYIGMYVDDFKVLATSDQLLDDVMILLKTGFPIQFKDQSMYLGMHIVHDRIAGVLTVDQRSQIAELAKIYGVDKRVKVWTPVEPGTVLVKALPMTPAVEFPYRELVGSLLWIARASRPDILYGVGCCARQVTSPQAEHVTALLRILEYLVSTEDMVLTLTKPKDFDGSWKFAIFSDANFAREAEGSDESMRSTSGLLVTIVGVGCIYAQSVLQSTVATSTHERTLRWTMLLSSLLH
jgi:hypothetical protein